MKRFVEDKIELSFDSPVHFMQSVACMLLTAPYKLVMAVSAKILYLPKASIMKVFFNSVIISGLITVINIAFQLYIGKFSLFRGKLPIIVMIITMLLLLGCYFVISLTDFTIYTQLNDIFPDSESIEDLEEESKSVSNAEEIDSNQNVSETLEFEDNVSDREEDNEVSKDSHNTDKDNSFSDDSRIYYRCVPEVNQESLHRVKLKVGAALSEDDYATFVKELEETTKPSKFLSENLLAKFSEDKVIEDDINLEALNIGVIPNNFKALA